MIACLVGAFPLASAQTGANLGLPSEGTQTSSDTGTERSEKGPFATKYARFTPADWKEIPGWQNEEFIEGWRAFLEGCRTLARRPAWGSTCERALAEPRRSVAEIRRFFESEFEPFKVTSPDLAEIGVMTGYFEPLLQGSRVRTDRFRYPIYGTPPDLLYLDGRLLKSRAQSPRFARVDGRNVIPLREPLPDAQGDTLYRLELGAALTDARDRKVRVRVEGDRIVPYLTRQEIEQSPGLNALAIAWVDNPDLLYILHIQGSGRVRLPNGEVMRVAFAEQNGHPFLPKIVSRISQQVRTRGGGGGMAPPGGPEASAEVQRLVDMFLGQLDGRGAMHKESKSSTIAKSGSTVARDDRRSRPDAPRAPAEGAGSVPTATPKEPKSSTIIKSKSASPGDGPGSVPDFPILVSSVEDPSYVFFREISAGEGGPPGALGVPLTPGRSLAVDPRVTPLGAPVFVSARRPGGSFGTDRLMVAQDTGGAIRGAVRADYFWGFGKTAGAEAMRMKDDLRMWVLLPKSLDLSALSARIRTRGPGGPEAVECVIADDELCVE
jgi:membrane-bound lytic murein transglycosylase A